MISETDRKIVDKIKPELKRLNLSQQQRWAVGSAIRENPQCLDECVKYLKGLPEKTDGEDIASSVIEICYKE